MIPLWAIKLGAIAALALALFSAGAYSHMRWADAKAAKAALQASEQARKDERENAVSAIRKLDNFAAAQAADQGRALAARSDLEQLRGGAQNAITTHIAITSALRGFLSAQMSHFGSSIQLCSDW
ncbi:MAG: hypothetical protein JF599_14155 [Verrucomicrobia bacterium]|nr:hypothetical protein [Verrucomicrobiota bacterium]